MTLLAIAAVAAAAIVFGGKKKKRRPKREPERGELSVEEAMVQALSEAEPGDTVDDIANRAYWLGYPDCPQTLDAGNPEHEDCIGLWVQMRDAIDRAIAEQGEKPEGVPCDALDPTTWPAGTVCVETSSGFRAFESDWAKGCSGAIRLTQGGGGYACLTDGSIEDIADFVKLSEPFDVLIEPFGEGKGGPAFVGTDGIGDDRVLIALQAPNPFGAAGVRALYLGLYVADENPHLHVTVMLIADETPRGVPKYLVERSQGGEWMDEIWLPVDDGYTTNWAETSSFVKETY